MKKIFLILAALFSFSSFARTGEWRVYSYWWSSNPSGNLPTETSISFSRIRNDLSPVYCYFNGNANIDWFGVLLNGDSSFLSVLYPAGISSASVSNATKTASYSILNSDDGFYYSPLCFPEVQKLYSLVNFLFQSGYRGSGFDIKFDNGSTTTGSRTVKLNFNPNSILSDCLFSTNTLYRSVVVGYLQDIVSVSRDLLSNSASGLSAFSSFLDDYRGVNYYSLAPTSAYSSVYSPVLYDNPLFWYGSSSYPFSDVLDELQSSLFLSDSDSEAVARRSLLNDSLKPIFSDAVRAYLLDQSSGVHKLFQDYVSNPSMSQSVIAGHYSTPTTNAVMQGAKKISDDVRESLSNNTQQIKKQLADWHNFASNGVREVNGNLSTIAGNTSSSSLKSAIESANIHIGDSVNVVLDGPVTIDSEQFSTVSVPLNSLKSSVDDWYSQWADFYFSSSPEKGWVKFFDVVSDFKDVNHSDLVSIQSCVSNLLASFSSYTNGLPFAISNAIAGLSISSTNSYLLLSDYADYIHSGGLDALLDVMDDDSYAELKSEVDSLYHADTAEGYGRWWRYFTGLSTVQANSIFKLSNIFLVHEKLLKDLKRDNSDLDVQDVSDPSVFRKLLYSIPSQEDTFNKLSQLTNSIDQSGMVRVHQLIPDLTNSFSVAAALFDKDFHLPSVISWELIPADPSINSKARIVTIRPLDHYRLFQMLHYGLAFSYCLVNLILFPKFLLLLVRLFDRVWNKSEKLIYNSTQS